MRGNSHVRFLGEGGAVMLAPYPTFEWSFCSTSALVGEFQTLMYLSYTSILKFTARLDLEQKSCFKYLSDTF